MDMGAKQDIKIGKFIATHRCMPQRLYRIWRGIRFRCHDKKSNAYQYYGDRGISVCNKWRNSFEDFRNWAISHGYSDNLTIDRINNNGNYSPDNCRWISLKEQNRNTSKNIRYMFNGKMKTITEIAEKCGIKNWRSLWKRLNRGWTLKEALSVSFEKRKPSIKTRRKYRGDKIDNRL